MSNIVEFGRLWLFLKEVVHPKSKIHICPLPCSDIYQSRILVWVAECWRYGTRLEVLRASKKHIWKPQHQCLFPEITTWLLKIIHKPCFEQFYIGTLFFLPNYTHQLYHCAEGRRGRHIKFYLLHALSSFKICATLVRPITKASGWV